MKLNTISSDHESIEKDNPESSLTFSAADPLTARKPWRNLILNSSLTLFSLILFLISFEIAFRLLKLGEPKPQWYDRPKFYYNPESSPTLRGNIHPAKKVSSDFRIAVVGDSFTFAPYMQFDDAFPMRLERMLNLNKSSKAEVLNYGVPCYSTSHEVSVVKRAIADGANMVLLQITLNDPEIKPYTPRGLYVSMNPYGATVERQEDNWLYRHWKSLAYLSRRLYFSDTHRNYKDYFFELFSNPKNIKAFSDSLNSIAQISSDAGVPVLAVVFPLFGLPLDNTYPFTPLHQHVHGLLNNLKIPYLDLFDTYKGIPAERLVVMPGEDFHPNEIAHRMAAESIYTWLKETKHIPDEVLIKVNLTQRTQIDLKQSKALSK